MLLTGLRGASANLIVSNVPGPTKPVYIAGTQVEALYPGRRCRRRIRFEHNRFQLL